MVQIRKLVRNAVKIMLPEKRIETSPSERLDHIPGLDRIEYGSRDLCESHRNNASIEVEGTARRLFFLCGHPRSGTHWMGAVLNRHPKIKIDGEYRFEALRNAVEDMTGKGWHAASREPMKSEMLACFDDTLRRVVGASALTKQSALWVGDRTPRPLKCFLEGAPHFLILRDPRDVLVSWAHQQIKNAGFVYAMGGFEAALGKHREAFLANPDYFRENPGLLLGHEPWLRLLARRWVNHTRTDIATLLAADRGEIATVVHVIRYERIHADPERERVAMYHFLGLDPAEADPLDDRSKTRAGLAEENPHALFRKGAVGDWRNYFTPEVTSWFNDEAGQTLIECGYETSLNW